MNFMTSKKSWLTAPVLFLSMCVALVAVWAAIPPERLIPLFDNHGASPVELMTLPLFALLVPLAWLCPPFGGTARRQALWNLDVTLLAAMAIVRETDLHKMAFAGIWPDIAENFTGTVFKMKFLKASAIPLAPKLFVGAFFAVFFAVTVVTFIRYARPLFAGIFRLCPVAWTWAVFGGTSVMVLVVDRLPAVLRHNGFDGPLLDKHSGSVAALMKVFEEGGEMMMALFALMAILQAHLFLRERGDVAQKASAAA